jgi:hypothetical protein
MASVGADFKLNYRLARPENQLVEQALIFGHLGVRISVDVNRTTSFRRGVGP